MKVEAFLERIPSDFFTGVPDSQLKALCDALMERYGISERHIIAENEGNAVALATGHFLASGEVPTVYLQNSGEGNAMNPLASLCAKGVYTLIREDGFFLSKSVYAHQRGRNQNRAFLYGKESDCFHDGKNQSGSV